MAILISHLSMHEEQMMPHQLRLFHIRDEQTEVSQGGIDLLLERKSLKLEKSLYATQYGMKSMNEVSESFI